MSNCSSIISGIIGPVLILDDIRDGALHLAALFIASAGQVPGPLTVDGQAAPMQCIAHYPGASVHVARFTRPATRRSVYAWDGQEFPLAGDLSGDLRLAFVSCNGEETGDLDREGSERNAMWARLGAEHRRAPFALLLHGGDQVYADEATHGHPLSDGWPGRLPTTPTGTEVAGLRKHLREKFLARYAALYAAPEFAWLAARVPSLMQWDDHDICDGWGSLAEGATRSAVGQTLFSIAREAFLVFQHGAQDGALPPRFHDRAGGSLGWSVQAPGLRLLAPDLRSERTRRQVMGPAGWAMMDTEARRAAPGRTLLMSSVPLLGPRLSLLESLMLIIPKMQHYEDDLRDQWQSRAHRASWQRMLRLVCNIAQTEGQDITALSGEIHLATRATMDVAPGHVLHQLVASGISHRAPPKAWARILGSIALLGEAPLKGHPIRIHRIPGQPGRYAAERNYLTLARSDGAWSAVWVLEHSGPSDPLAI
jgi:hypothetical protein